jgi:hypothetical protein
MKKLLFLVFIASFFFFSCNSNKNFSSENTEKLTSDTIHISNPDLEYEVIIIDGRFTSWFNSYAKREGYYSQSYLEARNRFWVMEWNNRARNPMRYGNMYDMPINYENNIDYGYHVNYMIYNYLLYFQITNKQQLGGFTARL